ncbi:MAG: hypothetical protein WCG80_16750 [Spirochaetales bacterium]
MRWAGLLAALVLSVTAGAQETLLPGFPGVAPQRERVFNLDEHALWTLKKGDQAAVLTVVPTEDRIAVGLSGGWLLLGPDLEYQPSSFDLLAAPNLPGSPWAQAVGSKLVFVSGSPGDLVVVYPDTAVVFRQPLDLANLSQLVVTDKGLMFAQGRRVSGKGNWNKALREEQPLPFFPADLTAGADGTPWAADSLQARPWHMEEGYWRPLEVPDTGGTVASGRLASLTPFADSTGYVAAGSGWAGAFRNDGSMLWLRDRDFSGRPLPRDLRVRGGNGKILLWSALERRIWLWSWKVGGVSGKVLPPQTDKLASDVTAEMNRLEALGSLPEALSVAQYGLDLAASQLKLTPFSEVWKQAREEFGQRRQTLKEQLVGAGVFTLTWESPFGKPLATWSWDPDAAWLDVKAWRAEVIPYREGRAWDTEDFKIAVTASRTPFPGAFSWSGSALQWPSWLSVKLRPDATTDAVHWLRLPYPEPPPRYDLPVE